MISGPQSLPELMLMIDTEFYNYRQQLRDAKKVVAIIGSPKSAKTTFFKHLTGLTETSNYVPNFKLGLRVDGEQFCLVDTPGFQNKNEDYLVMLGAAYSLHRVMCRTAQIKFVYVIESDELKKLEHFRVEIDNLCSLFDCEMLQQNPQSQAAILNSVLIVISKVCKDTRAALDQVKKQFMDATANKTQGYIPFARQLLNQATLTNRIVLFQQAQAGNQEQILNKFLRHSSWRYYSFDQNIAYAYAVKLPFQQAAEYNAHIDKRTQAIKKSVECLRQFMRTATKNWTSDTRIDYQAGYNQLSEIISLYKMSQEVLVCEVMDLQAGQQQPRNMLRLELIQCIQAISAAVDQVRRSYSRNSKQSQKLQLMEKPYLQVLNQFRSTFCRNQDEVQAFTSLMFLNSRFLAEIKVLETLGRFNKGAQIQLFNFLGDFLQSSKIMQPSNTGKPCSMDTLLQEFFAQLIKVARQEEDPKIQKMQARVLENISNNTGDKDGETTAQLLRDTIQYQLGKAIRAQHRGEYQRQLRFLDQARKLHIVLRGLAYQPQEPGFKQYLQFKLREIYTKIAMCLKKMKLYLKALSVFQRLRSVSHSLKCYQEYVESEMNVRNKFDIVKKFISFLQRYGKKQRLISLLEQLIDDYYFYPEEVQQWKGKLHLLLSTDLRDEISTYKDQLAENYQIEELPDRDFEQMIRKAGKNSKIKQLQVKTENYHYNNRPALQKKS